MKKYLIIIGIVAIFGMIATIKIQKKLLETTKIESAARLDALKNFNKELIIMRAKDSTTYVTINALNLSVKEVKEILPGIESKITNVGKKLRDIESVIEVGSQTEVHIETRLRDSILFDTIPIKKLDYKDDWVDLSGIVYENNDIELEWRTWDTLNIFLEKGRGEKKFLFWRYGTKQYPITVNNRNPNSKLFYSRFVKIRKNKEK